MYCHKSVKSCEKLPSPEVYHLLFTPAPALASEAPGGHPARLYPLHPWISKGDTQTRNISTAVELDGKEILKQPQIFWTSSARWRGR